jgi:hypothetical protein
MGIAIRRATIPPCLPRSLPMGAPPCCELQQMYCSESFCSLDQVEEEVPVSGTMTPTRELNMIASVTIVCACEVRILIE